MSSCLLSTDRTSPGMSFEFRPLCTRFPTAHFNLLLYLIHAHERRTQLRNVGRRSVHLLETMNPTPGIRMGYRPRATPPVTAPSSVPYIARTEGEQLARGDETAPHAWLHRYLHIEEAPVMDLHPRLGEESGQHRVALLLPERAAGLRRRSTPRLSLPQSTGTPDARIAR